MGRKLTRILLVSHHRRFKTVSRSEPIARHLARRGYEVTLMCISDNARFMVSERDEGGVRFVEMPDLLPGKLRSGWDAWDTVNRVVYLRKREFDLIHAFETRPATIYPVKSYLARKRVPLIIDWVDWWGRGGLISELRPRWYQLLFEGIETYYEENFRGMADSLTVISSALAERAEGLGIPRERIYKIRGGADLPLFVPQNRLSYRKEFGIPEDKFVLAASAADVSTDLDIAIRCLRVLVERNQNVMLVVTGNKPPWLDQLVDREGLQGSFMHLGFLKYEDLPKALSCADVFILPFPDRLSNRGRWPHKIADYMSLAKPTVTNAVGEMKLLFEEEKIGLLAKETPEDLALQVDLLIKNPALSKELGQNARRAAETRLSWETTIDGLENVYMDTIKRFNCSKSGVAG